MAAKALPPQEVLLQLLRYEPETGRLYWRRRDVGLFQERAQQTAVQSANAWNAKFAGKEAFPNIQSTGYRSGCLNYERYLAHRIIWKMMSGEDPDEVDHIDGNRLNNRFENLRSVDRLTNGKNLRRKSSNTSGCTGVVWSRLERRWVARIRVRRRHLHLGGYPTFEEAVAARKQAELDYGFHPNHDMR